MQYDRKTFLKGALATGAMLTMPAFLGGCATRGRLAGPGGPDPLENAAASGMDEPILKAINCGITAPNPHNTQSWKFRLRGDSEAVLYADENRLLPETDPPARQIHIGCGTFLEHLAIGAREMGSAAEIAYFPEGEYQLQDIGRKPVAHIRLVPGKNDGKDPLYQQIAQRLTDRTPYDGPIVTDAEFAGIRQLMGATHARLKTVNTPDAIKSLYGIFQKGMAIEVRTHHTYEESRVWFRYDDEEIYKERDGISWRTAGMSTFKRILAQTFVGRSEEEWHAESNKEMYLKSWDETVESSKAFAYLETERNTQTDWVKTGRDYARLQLAVTAAGLRMHPMSQVLQEYVEMSDLQKKFNTQLGIRGRVQMVVRVGRGNESFRAPRRSPQDMLVS